jgi:hypothetical protein
MNFRTVRRLLLTDLKYIRSHVANTYESEGKRRDEFNVSIREIFGSMGNTTKNPNKTNGFLV